MEIGGGLDVFLGFFSLNAENPELEKLSMPNRERMLYNEGGNEFYYNGEVSFKVIIMH